MTDPPIPFRRPELVVGNKKEIIGQLVNFAIVANHLVTSLKPTKSVDLARELKNYETNEWQWHQL